jgi:hypothetical protein
MITRNYPGKDVEMLTVTSTIADNAISCVEYLSGKRPVWADPFFPDLRARINRAFTHLGIDAASAQRGATRIVLQLQSVSLFDLSEFKVQLEADFKTDKPRLTEILKQLGYTDYYKLAQNKDQEGLIQLLYRFSGALTPALRTEITAKGINAEYFDRISSYAEQLAQANITQETFKGSKKLVTEEAITEFNAIYDEVIAIAKIAHSFYRGNPTRQAQFSYAKIRSRLNAHPRAASPEADEVQSQEQE